MTEEKWKSLKDLGFSNYEVSDSGKIRNIKYNRPLYGNKRYGYIRMCMTDDNKNKRNVAQHVLVAKAFLGIPDDESLTVDHINRIRDDNRVENLRWATKSEQTLNSNNVERKGRAVYQIDMKDNIIKRWNKISDASKELKIFDSNIGATCKGKVMTAGGFKWKYCDDLDVNEDEVWKKIPYPELENIMLVSNLGRLKYIEDGKITIGSEVKGYLNIGPRIGGKRRRRAVHRLVMAAFHGINEEMLVNHKDGNKTNNKLENLEYCTRQENALHAVRTGLIDCSKLGVNNRIPVVQYTLLGEKLAEYESITAAAMATDCDDWCISRVCKGQRKTTAGFKWKYKKDIQ